VRFLELLCFWDKQNQRECDVEIFHEIKAIITNSKLSKNHFLILIRNSFLLSQLNSSRLSLFEDKIRLETGVVFPADLFQAD